MNIEERLKEVANKFLNQNCKNLTSDSETCFSTYEFSIYLKECLYSEQEDWNLVLIKLFNMINQHQAKHGTLIREKREKDINDWLDLW